MGPEARPGRAERIVSVHRAKSVDELFQQIASPSAPTRGNCTHPHLGDGHETKNQSRAAQGVNVVFAEECQLKM